MAKVFTITEGLENMGALKTGGQGSVYKGRRRGEIFTAIKILPTPIYSESAEDKNFLSFQNEVQKLKKVNETPNPNVVKIINSGITDSGNFPFIEMEYIEGPDLEELLKPPLDSIFTIKEAIKVAEQLSHALAHCHKMEVRHGDVKSNNVKFNAATGNYILLDFGLSVMSDEQRRTSLRHAGAVEFMAPEQHEGQMLFQTDVYSFGVIMFELLGGIVPFPLKDKGESSRNNVMVSHMEMMPPDIAALRQHHLPATWNEEKKARQLHIPDWLVTMVYKCLEKQPVHRFENGIELHDYIQRNSILTATPKANDEQLVFLQKENQRLLHEKEELQKELLALKQNVGNNWHTSENRSSNNQPSIKQSFFVRNIVWFLLIGISIAGIVYVLYKNKERLKPNTSDSITSKTPAKEKIAPLGNETIVQLNQASDYVANAELAKGLAIYSSLSQQQVPQAMYQYGNLALQNLNKQIDCVQAFGLIVKAANKGYVPAKRTVGFFYTFAEDEEALRQNNYTRCLFGKNTAKGAKYLMEAMLAGDTTASRLLDELNAKY